MTKRLRKVSENGKTVWRIAETPAEPGGAPCGALRKAREKALRVHHELEAERLMKQESAGTDSP
jgi:hypothetical protein